MVFPSSSPLLPLRRLHLPLWSIRPAAVLFFAFAIATVGINLGRPTSASAAATTLTVEGSGWGHAVGMSQWGARGRAANRGETYVQILKHYFTGTAVEARTASNDVRVLVAKGRATITLTASGRTTIGPLGTLEANESVTLTRSGTNLVASGRLTGTIASPLVVSLSTAGGPVGVSGAYSYRYGSLRVDTNATSGLRAIVGSMTMQQFLYGLGEMPMSWPVEALKSQATAARSFAQYQITSRAGNATYADHSLDAAVDGAYSGTRYENQGQYFAKWVDAVNATNNQMITYNGAVIQSFYSASSGGYTADSKSVWGGDRAYLKAVPDPDDLTGGNPNASWSVNFTANELGSKFDIGAVRTVTIDGPVPASGRLDSVPIKLVGTTGTTTVTGATFRSKTGIKSAFFRITGAQAATSQPPATPPYRPPTGAVLTAAASGRTITIAGNAKDPDGPVYISVISTMGTERAVRNLASSNGTFSVSWNGAPGTRNVCVTVYDNPTAKQISLGCRDVVVK